MSARLRHGSPAYLIYVGLFVAFCMTALSLRMPLFLQGLDNKVYDSFQRGLAEGVTSNVPVIVDIDEKSLRLYGQWPWPRYLVARLLREINESRAASVAIDIVFAEADRTSLTRIREEAAAELGVRMQLEGPVTGKLDNDAILAGVLEDGPFVLALEFLFDKNASQGEACLRHPLNLALLSRGKAAGGQGFFSARGVICNIPILSQAVRASGFFNATADRDGVLRRVPLVIEYEGRHYPSLALAAIMSARGDRQMHLEDGLAGRFLVVGQNRIPIDAMGNLLLRYRGGARTFRYIPAADILDGRVGREELDGKIVIIGTTAAGLQEIRTSPMEVKHPGPEIHANVIDNILAGEFNARTGLTRLAEAMVVFLLGSVAALALVRLRAVESLAVISLGVFALWSGADWFFASSGYYVSPLMPCLALLLSYTVVESLERWEEEKKVRARTREFVLAQEAIIHGMASLAETRDSETGGHILRTQHYVRVLAERLLAEGAYPGLLDGELVDILFKVAPLHDVGKVGVRDSVLLKPDKLTTEEFEEMKKHTLYASQTLKAAEDHLEGNRFLRLAREIAESHQEWWNGSGYPHGLEGERIPLSGRIMAVADVYDALISRRRYKGAYDHNEAVRIMTGERGTHFDPAVFDAFLIVQNEFRAIATRYADG